MRRTRLLPRNLVGRTPGGVPSRSADALVGLLLPLRRQRNVGVRADQGVRPTSAKHSIVTFERSNTI